MTEALLEVVGLDGGYEPVQIFRDVSLTVPYGSAIGLFGPNGHGKSTFLRTISGLLDPWRGDIFFDGRRLNKPGERGSRRWRHFNYDAIRLRRMSPEGIARAGLIHVPQGNLLFPEMTVAETLSIAPFAANGRITAGQAREQVFTLFPRLHERRHSKIRFLSGGERQMAAIGSGLMAAPKLLVLDEPTLGLSPRLRGELSEAIHAIRVSGTPLIVVDQDVGFLKSLVETVYLFNHGRITEKFATEDLPAQEELMTRMFGEATL